MELRKKGKKKLRLFGKQKNQIKFCDLLKKNKINEFGKNILI